MRLGDPARSGYAQQPPAERFFVASGKEICSNTPRIQRFAEESMGQQYKCPKCGVVLNPCSEIILCGRNGSTRSLFLFRPEVGNYDYHTSPGTTIVPGEVWEFYCPVCQHDLTTSFTHSLAELNMLDDKGTEHRIIFSKRADEKATFDISPEGVHRHGPHQDRYFDEFIQKIYW